MRLLYLQTSPVPPPGDCSADRFALLSEVLEGEVLQPIWYRHPEQVEKTFGPGSWPFYTRGRFRYRWSLVWRWTGLNRFLHTLWFYVSEGLRAHREKPIDCVMTYSHMTTALCGIVIKVLTGAKLVVEVISTPERVFIKEHRRARFVDRLRRRYSDVCLHISLLSCDCVHLLYDWQLDSYPLLRRVPRVVFHEFTPVSTIARHDAAIEPYILLVGAPWYLKGADLLVEAFRRIAPDFPDFRLKLMGHYPDRDQLELLTEGLARIEVMAPQPHKETLRIISHASVLVLASRCEGMGRVLLEAMAAGIPVVGSRIGGIPTLIRDGENGFLFPEEDVDALEMRLRQLLADPDLREKMGARGYEMSHGEFSERVYVDRFMQMIETAVHPGKPDSPPKPARRDAPARR